MEIKNCDFGCLGYAYTPVQIYNEKNVFSPENALNNASLFPELVLGIADYGKKCRMVGGVSDGN